METYKNHLSESTPYLIATGYAKALKDLGKNPADYKRWAIDNAKELGWNRLKDLKETLLGLAGY